MENKFTKDLITKYSTKVRDLQLDITALEKNLIEVPIRLQALKTELYHLTQLIDGLLRQEHKQKEGQNTIDDDKEIREAVEEFAHQISDAIRGLTR